MNTNLLRNHWCKLHRHEVRSLQAAKLRQFLREVICPYHPHYREEFIRLGIHPEDIHELEDLALLPFSSKASLTKSPDEPKRYIISPSPEELKSKPSTILRALLHGKAAESRRLREEFQPLLMTSTTGRSCEPVPFVYTGHDVENLKLAGARTMEIARATPGDRMLNMFPFAPHLAFWQTHYAGTQYGVFMLSSGGGKTVGTEGNIRMLGKLRPQALIGMPTFVYHVLHEAVLDGVKCPNLKSLVLGGEKVPRGMREKLSQLAEQAGAREVDVISTYGFTEAKQAWCECPFPIAEDAPGYHLFPDLGIVEIVDPQSGKILPDGTPGEIAFTPLDARGSCVLRYRTGDLSEGGLTYEPCPHCGRIAPRLMGRISRKSEVRELQLDKLKGTLVDFNELEHLLDGLPRIGAWQIELGKAHNDPMEVDELILHITTLEPLDEEVISEEIASRVFERTELHPNRIIFHGEAEMKRLQGVGEALKEQKLVDNRPKAAREEAGANREALR